MTAKIDIIRTDEGTHGAYRIQLDGVDKPAELTWVAHGDVRDANHTYTPPAMRGQGIAMHLVKAMIADAREQGFKIQPSCPYVEVAFRRHPEWADVRA